MKQCLAILAAFIVTALVSAAPPGPGGSTPPPPKPKPDLVCSFTDKMGWMYLRVTNLAAPPAAAAAKNFYAGYNLVGTNTGSWLINSLSPGASHERKVHSLPLPSGSVVKGYVDSTNKIGERDEDNNTCLRSTRVKLKR